MTTTVVGNLIIVFLPLPASLKLILLLTGMLIQLTASVWYTLSYIPYGRRTAIRILKGALGGSWDESSGNIDYSIVGFGNGSGGGGVLS